MLVALLLLAQASLLYPAPLPGPAVNLGGVFHDILGRHLTPPAARWPGRPHSMVSSERGEQGLELDVVQARQGWGGEGRWVMLQRCVSARSYCDYGPDGEQVKYC